LQDNYGGRLLVSELADSLADVCDIILETQHDTLPPWAATRLSHIRQHMADLSRACRWPTRAI